ncbi:MAG: hypothetical protein PUE12_17715 [Oscillospiraceae bacterium]|nr:hypothetical protein [Oscillospiraceae bacterium]
MDKTHCPICKHNAKWEYWSGPYGIEEEYITCPTCGYYYKFAYGGYAEVVGNKWFVWNYATNSNNPIFKRMHKAEFMAKRRWKKFRKGVTCKDCPI